MATKPQVYRILAAASGPTSRTELADKIGEKYGNFQSQLDRWEKDGEIENVGDHHYILTEKGREVALEKTTFAEEAEEPGFQKEPEESEASLGATEYQQFLKFGKRVGVTPLSLIKITADHVWDGGDFRDLKWVAQAMQEMGIMQDLRGRWFNRWRSYLKQGLPLDLPPEFFPTKKDGEKEGEKEKGSGKRDYILEEDDHPTFIGEGLGDLDYKDALDLAKVRAAAKAKGSNQTKTASPGDIFAAKAVERVLEEIGVGDKDVRGEDEISKTISQIKAVKELMSEFGNVGNKSPVDQVENLVSLIKSLREVFVENKTVSTITPQAKHIIVDKATGKMETVEPGSIIFLPQPTQASQPTPIQVKDKDGNPMVLDLSTFIKLEEHRDKQRRDEESHEIRMDLAKGFKDLLGKASTALGHAAEEK